MSKVISISIGITIFILLICGSYMQMGMSTDNSNYNYNSASSNEKVIEYSTNIVYNGKIPIPIENLIKVTSGFGIREAHGVVHSNHTGIDLVRTCRK